MSIFYTLHKAGEKSRSAHPSIFISPFLSKDIEMAKAMNVYAKGILPGSV